MPETSIKLPSVRGGGEVIEREFIRVVFQNGLPKQVGINGCRVEDVIDVAIERLEEYQAGLMPCEENERALRGLKDAVMALHERVVRRREQGVLNTFEPHRTIRTEDVIEDFSATGS